MCPVRTSGETITYQYDALKRLTQASSTPIAGSTPAAWTQNYTYDGFGNILTIALNGTTTSTYTVDSSTNQFTSSYDFNGNSLSANGMTLVYDEANRVFEATNTGGQHEYYGYAPDNKRIYRLEHNGAEEWTFYGAKGEKLGTFAWSDLSGTGDCACVMNPVTSNVWFAGRLVWDGRPWSTGASGATYQDRVGTNRADGARFYPYGQEITSTVNDHEKFATYQRDSFSQLDYADQRYYDSSYGRFNTPDPGKSASPSSSLSWNRYSYTAGDPVNHNDPRGLCVQGDDGNWWDGEDEEQHITSASDYSNPGVACTDDPMFLLAVQNGGDIVLDGQVYNSGGGGGDDGVTVGGPVDTAGGSTPKSLTNIQPFASNPWAPLAGALLGTPCGGKLQSAFSKSQYGAEFASLNQFLTAATGLGAVTGSATFVGGDANAITGSNAMMSGDLVMINASGAYFNGLPSGISIGPSNNRVFQQQIAAINGGTPEAQAFILLHELFHVLGLFQSDAGNQSAQGQNNTLMWFDCGSVIQGFSNK